MGDETPVFLTDERRDVLNGEYTGADSTERVHRSNIKARTQTALQELIEVASSPAFDNDDLFDTEDVYTLVSILLTGTGGFTEDGEKPTPAEVREQYDDYELKAWKPDDEYAHELYVKLDKGLRRFHEEDTDRTPRSSD